MWEGIALIVIGIFIFWSAGRQKGVGGTGLVRLLRRAHLAREDEYYVRHGRFAAIVIIAFGVASIAYGIL